jgi:carboxyl-terminal processing protease
MRLAAAVAVCGSALAAAAAGQGASPAPERAALNLESFDFAWQKIADTFWEEEMGGVDWRAVGDELRPRARDAADARELRNVIQEMLARLGQSHFGVLPGAGSADGDDEPAEGDGGDGAACTPALMRTVSGGGGSSASDAGPGFEVRFVDHVAMVSRVEAESAAGRSGLAVGVEIVRVGDQDLAALSRCFELESLNPRVADMVRARAIDGLLFGAPGDPVEVELADGAGERFVLELERAHRPGAVEIGFGNLPAMQFLFETEEVETSTGERILVVRFNVWMMPVVEGFETALYGDSAAGASAFDGLLIDLRGNPGGVAGTAVGIAGYLLDQQVDLGRMLHRGSDLRLLVNPRRVSRSSERIDGFEGPVAVMIDGGSASTSEIFAAGLQDHGRARLFGEPSAAAALPAVVERMPNGDLLMHAIADFVRPNGERVEGRAVVPDSLVPLTREGLLSARDEPREAALAWIASELE